MASMVWAKAIAKRDKKHFSFGIWFDSYYRFDDIYVHIYVYIYICAINQTLMNISLWYECHNRCMIIHTWMMNYFQTRHCIWKWYLQMEMTMEYRQKHYLPPFLAMLMQTFWRWHCVMEYLVLYWSVMVNDWMAWLDLFAALWQDLHIEAETKWPPISWHFTDIFKCIFLNGNIQIWIKISLKFVRRVQ